MKKSIVRCDRSGVFFGRVVKLEGQTATVKNVRQIWYWEGANSTMQIAADGISASSKITVEVDEITITDVIEVIPCTAEAQKTMEGIAPWKA